MKLAGELTGTECDCNLLRYFEKTQLAEKALGT
jgi:hypothetical protein